MSRHNGIDHELLEAMEQSSACKRDESIFTVKGSPGFQTFFALDQFDREKTIPSSIQRTRSRS